MKCILCSTPLPDNSRYCFSCGADVSGDHAERTQRIEQDPELETMLQEDLGGEYIIEQLLQRGGMAAVFVARDAQLGRKVAIKVLPPELTHGTGDMVGRFKREARTAATLDHPHIVPIFRVSPPGRLFWYVMKFIDGESLGSLLEREGALTPPRVANILGQAAEALDFAHKKGVVHRDIKPDNIMLDSRGWVTVMDFGIAKMMDRPGVTGPGSTIGTPYYMSPEQCAGALVTPSADQYALGIVAYRMLTGTLPFRGETVLSVVHAHMRDAVPPLPASIPRPIADVVERALGKKAEHRFADVLEFADAFARAARRDANSWPPDARRLGAARTRPGARTPAGGLRVSAGRLLASRSGGTGARVSGRSGWAAALTLLGLGAILLRPESRAADAQVAPPADTVSRVAATPPLPAAPRPAPESPAYLTVGSQPLAGMTINGRATPGNPVANFPVPAGPVRLRFQVRDASGAWSFDTTVTVASGERRNIGRIALRRPAR